MLTPLSLPCYSNNLPILEENDNVVAPEPVNRVHKPQSKVSFYWLGKDFADTLSRYSLLRFANICAFLRNYCRKTFLSRWVSVNCFLFITNVVKNPFIKQSCVNMSNIKYFTVALEAVAACLDIRERLSCYVALLSLMSDQQSV